MSHATYAQGFAEGERQAFEDRRGNCRHGQEALQAASNGPVLSEYWRGFKDGYLPRSVGRGRHE